MDKKQLAKLLYNNLRGKYLRHKYIKEALQNPESTSSPIQTRAVSFKESHYSGPWWWVG